MVRYTGLVGAIDAYLEGVMSWDKSEAARRLGVANAGDGDGDGDGDSTISDSARAGLKSSAAFGSSSSGQPEQNQRQGRAFEDRVYFSPPPPPQQQQQLPIRSAKKTIRVGVDSPNSVARAARGWDNDVPVVAPGMRHYPQRTSNMAALVGNGGFDGRAGGSAAAPASPAASAITRPRHPMPSAHTTPCGANSGGGSSAVMSARDGNPAEDRGGQRDTPVYDMHGAAPASPSGRHQQSRCSRVDFVPAGGRSGLDKPEGSSGRRGSVGKSLGLAGGGVSRSLVDAASPPAEGGFPAETPPPGRAGGGAGLRGASSPGVSWGECEGGGDPSSAAVSRRRQSNTGQLRELVQAWPEDASPASERRGGSCGSNASSDRGNDDGGASPGRCGGRSPGARGSRKGGSERRWGVTAPYAILAVISGSAWRQC